MIKRLYECLYVNLYQWSVKLEGVGESALHSWNASFMLASLIFINLTTVISVVHVFTGWGFPDSGVCKIAFVGLMGLTSILNYKYFTFKDRYIELVRQYQSHGMISSYIVGFSVLGSITLLFLVWFVGLEVKV